MQKKYKKWLTFVILIISLGIGITSYFLVAINSVSDENEVKDIKIDRNNLPTEYEFRNDIHKMTHQKVYAEKKRGHLQITNERINYMLKILENTNYNMEDMYRDVLTEWQVGNFENSVETHNILLSLEYGTAGRASRLLTPSEEQEYIKEHFKNNMK